MAFEKAPPERNEQFLRLTAGLDGAIRRKMFGYDAAFVNGNWFAGMWSTGVLVKLPEDEVRAMVLEGSESFAPMAGRTMREVALIPFAQCDDESFLTDRLRRSLKFVGALPGKDAKPKAKKAPAKKK